MNRTAAVLSLVLLLCLLPQVMQAQEAGTRNATWTISDGKIVISYDLVVPDGYDYDVAVVLRRESDPAFAITPISVTGDAGGNVRAGSLKKVIWDFRKDLQVPLSGNDYYFEFKIRMIEPPSSSKWWLYAAGGAAAAVAAAVLLSKGSGGETQPGSATTLLPDAPHVRPAN